MDERQTAEKILQYIGGKENIASILSCATRIRIVLENENNCDRNSIQELEAVKGIMHKGRELHIVLGSGSVNKIFVQLQQILDNENKKGTDVPHIRQKRSKISAIQGMKHLMKLLGDIFIPIIPAMVASGLLVGILEGLCEVYPAMEKSGTYTILHLFSNAAFVFLPILIAISAAKVFGGNLYLGAVIGMIMIHPDLMNAWSVVGAESIPKLNAWFGLYQIELVGYQGHVIPVVIAVWFMSMLEKKLHKIVPEMIDLFVTPLVTVFVTGYLTLTIFGPVFSWVENGVLEGAQWLITLPFGIGAALCGAVYAPTVVAGVHHMYSALEAGLISNSGFNTWMPIATAANVGQGAAALALALKTKNSKVKALALPASLSAFLGITEPAIFGVNIRYIKPFVAGMIGGACGALIAGWTGIGATAYGITGLFGYLITTDDTLQYTLVIGVAFVVSFVTSWMLYQDEKAPGEKAAPRKQ